MNKYNVGDVVKIRSYTTKNIASTTFQTSIAVIISDKQTYGFLYDIIVCGKENKTYFVQQKDIVEKL